MSGKFNYSDLEKRLIYIRRVLDDEMTLWAEQGPKAKDDHERIATNLLSQFEQCRQWFGGNPRGVTLDLEMEKDNPFAWRMVCIPILPVSNLSVKWAMSIRLCCRTVLSPAYPSFKSDLLTVAGLLWSSND